MAKNLSRKDNDIFIQPGTHIHGKWNKNEYIVQRKIGAGMIGTVYLCRRKNKLVALKMSNKAMSMTTEVNVLKALNKVQDNRLGPFLLDVDDWITERGQKYSFYVMEYIKGKSLEEFIRRNGDEWIGVFLVQILEQLDQLHHSGWVFGDLKNDNLLISGSPPRIRFIDVGGTTKIGRSIKEYSEFYDRAYWYLGTREAEPSYDLFAVVMVFLTVFFPKKFKRTHHSHQLIIQKVNEIPALKPYRRCFHKAILGKYDTARQMKEDVLHALISRQSIQRFRRNHKTHLIVEAMIISILSGICFTVTYFLF